MSIVAWHLGIYDTSRLDLFRCCSYFVFGYFFDFLFCFRQVFDSLFLIVQLVFELLEGAVEFGETLAECHFLVGALLSLLVHFVDGIVQV